MEVIKFPFEYKSPFTIVLLILIQIIFFRCYNFLTLPTNCTPTPIFKPTFFPSQKLPLLSRTSWGLPPMRKLPPLPPSITKCSPSPRLDWRDMVRTIRELPQSYSTHTPASVTAWYWSHMVPSGTERVLSPFSWRYTGGSLIHCYSYTCFKLWPTHTLWSLSYIFIVTQT